ncbi:MAG: biotin transporter BioY [Spirochaetia bacterium]|jgi:biotin transport system substrate-specific component|nr:biotin transporter BioY [Spirochaetia bacterium]
MDKSAKNLSYAVLSCLFAALMAVGAFIAVPLPFSPVPIVLQTMFMLLAALILGPWWAGISTLLYLLLGLIGLPVFSGGTGGPAAFLGPTGGYLAGYIPCSIVVGLIAGKARNRRVILFLACLAGMLPVYGLGVLRLKTVLDSGWDRAIAAGFLPFIPGDLIKSLVAALLAPKLSAGILSMPAGRPNG